MAHGLIFSIIGLIYTGIRLQFCFEVFVDQRLGIRVKALPTLLAPFVSPALEVDWLVVLVTCALVAKPNNKNSITIVIVAFMGLEFRV